MRGEYLHAPGRHGTFELHREGADKQAPSPERDVTGAYKSADAQWYAISRQDEDLFLIRIADGWGRRLKIGSAGKLEYGPTLLRTEPMQGYVTVQENPQGLQLEVRTSKDTMLFRGRRVPIKRSEVRFSNGRVQLAGTMLSPGEEGRWPGVVLLHGSSPALRGEPWMEALAARGYVVLTYYKRGSGASTGDWRAPFEDYAKDALAAVDHLRRSPIVMPERVGVYGPSQGGFVALLAAQSPTVAFAVLRSTSPVSVREQELFRLGVALRQHKFVSEEIEEALGFAALKFDAGISGQFDAYEAAAKGAKTRAWFEVVGGAPPRDHPAHKFWKWNGTFDPSKYVREARVPLLWLQGEFDEASPPGPPPGGLPNGSTWVRVPNADHGLLRTREMGSTEEHLEHTQGYAPEFLVTLFDWLEHVCAEWGG